MNIQLSFLFLVFYPCPSVVIVDLGQLCLCLWLAEGAVVMVLAAQTTLA